MYGDLEDPFGIPIAIGGGEFGAVEYLQILVDDLAAHLKAAADDESYHKALNPRLKVDNNSLAFLRRTRLIDSLLTKVMSSEQTEITSLAAPYAKQAEEYVETMVGKIVYATSSLTQTGTGTETTSGTETDITSIRFVNRRNLLQCQRNLERQYPIPSTGDFPLN